MSPSWIGRSRKPVEDTTRTGPDLPGSLKAALGDLARWTLPDPDWEPLRQRMRMVLRAAFSSPGTPDPSLDPADDQTPFLIERIHEGWAEGVPAVRVVTPALEYSSLLARVEALDACVERDYPAALGFRKSLKSEPEQILNWVGMMLMQGEETLLRSIQRSGVEPDYAFSTLRLGLLGELGEWSSRVAAQLRESSWPPGDCPVCAASPALAESRGLEKRRFLRCDRCGAGWPSDRLRCPFCGVNDHHAMRTLFAEEDQSRCRLVLCDACGGRLKVITSLAPLSCPGLVLAQFTMFYLDFVVDTSASRSIC